MWLRLLLLLSLAVKFTGEWDVIGSHEPIEVEVGQDAVLPCHREPPFNVTTLVVKWTWKLTSNATEILVHMRRSHGDNKDDPNEKFKNRTSLFSDEDIGQGNISLKLTNVTEQDAGNYSCYIRNTSSTVKKDSKKSYVILIVKPVTQERIDDPGTLSVGAIVGIAVGGGGVALLVALLAVCLVAVFIYKKKICRRNNNVNVDSAPGSQLPATSLPLSPTNNEENEVPQQAPDDRVVEDQQQLGGQPLLRHHDDCCDVDQGKPEDSILLQSSGEAKYTAGRRRGREESS